MLRWAQDGIRELALDDIGEYYGRYRLHLPEAERSMARSLERYGQISPMVVCLRDGHYELIDGFKRLAAARTISSLQRVSIRVILVDERGAKAAIYGLNRAGGRTRELEEAWIVHALVREDRLTQVEVAELLGRHKSWVCRRLALIERLGSEAKDELRVGLLCPTAARQIVRLPEGNQAEVLQAVRREALSTVELSAMVDLLLECPGRRQQEFVLQNPREALAQKKGFVAISSRDPRLSQTGNEVAKRLGFLIEMLAKMEVWLTTRGRTALTSGDQVILRPRFERLARDSASVASLSQDFVAELQPV
jgi:ParB-like chromosome segregation protein Spo0J